MCIGNFDGVHLGHQEIIRPLREKSLRQSCPLLVYSFSPHPTKVLVPKAAPPMIQTEAQKIKALSALGVSAVVLEPFDLDFFHLSARDFFDEIIVRRLAPREVSVGYNFNFGYHRSGNALELKRWGEAEGMVMNVVDAFFHGEILVSSTAVRRLLMDGEVEGAFELMGRSYEYAGTVVKGDARGRAVGFPTANLLGENEMLLKEGVYATWFEVEGKRFQSVTNIGTNPTFVGERPIHLETHLLDFKGDLYGKSVSVFFAKYLRGEQHFDGIEALRTQIGCDIENARRVFGEVQ